VLRWRLISAAVILALLLSAMWLDYRLIFWGTPGAWLFPILLVVTGLGTEEVLSLLRAKGHRLADWPVYFGNFAVPLAAGAVIVVGMFGASVNLRLLPGYCYLPLATLALSIGAIFFIEMQRYERPGGSIVRVALATFAVCYIGVLISFWALLRLYNDDNERGMLALFSMLLIVKTADTGAFAVGKKLGRNKMTPVLSPGKTWEGAIGGILVACLVSWAFFHWAGPHIVGSTYREPSALATIVYGTVLALAGMLGDLAESLLKRDMERKDSSTWLPGLGGVLDIIDAPLMAGPIAWLWWTSGLIGS
jgi:phosphatidate cytidylyltransferase